MLPPDPTPPSASARLTPATGRARAFWSALLFALALSLVPSTPAAEGDRIWAYTTNGTVFSSPALSSDATSGYTIYFGNQGTIAALSRMFAVNPNGSTQWTALVSTDWIDSSPTVDASGNLYFGSFDSKVYSLAANGSTRWSFRASDYIASSTALGSDGALYIGSGDRNLHALNPDGSLRWSFPVTDWVDSAPAIGPEDTIYFGSFDNFVYAVRSDGTLRWQFETGDSISSSPAIGADATVYIGSGDNKLYALDGATGAKKWDYATGGGISASPIVGADGTIYVGSLDGYFYALNADGSLKWRYNTGTEIYSSAALRADGTILFGANFYLYALNGDGSLRWRFLTGDYVDSSPVIAGNGTIYVGSSDRKLYAIAGNGQGPDVSAPWPLFRQNTRRTGLSPVTAFPVTATAPTIDSHPASASVTEGDSVSFSVSASGTAPLTYQWIKDSNPLPDSNAATYTLNSTTSADAGNYWVTVTNSAGTATSEVATLTINPRVIAPAITSQPTPQTVDAGATVTFSVTASGTAPLSYQWKKDGDALPDATAATLTLGPITTAETGSYTVTVTNSAGTATSEAATLTVNRLAQTLTFDGPAERPFNFAPVTLAAVATSGLAPTFTYVSGPASLDGSTLTLTGIGPVVVRADQAGNSTYAPAPAVTYQFAVTPSYDYWQFQHFTPTELADGTLTSATAIVSADGLPNLVKYALGLAASVPAASSQLPTPAYANGEWTYTYTRPASLPDVTVTVEASTDLTTWNPIASTRVATTEGVETWTATVAAASTPTLFFRLRVTRP